MSQSKEINSQAQPEDNHVNLNIARPPDHEMTLEEFLVLASREVAGNSIIRSEFTPNPMPQINEINYQAQLENDHVNLNTPISIEHEMTLEEYLAHIERETAGSSRIRSESTPNVMSQSNERDSQGQLENNHVNLNTPEPPQHEMALEEHLAQLTVKHETTP
ncbi:hypothetical protein ACFE04_016053 [Oxalis oulophora]